MEPSFTSRPGNILYRLDALTRMNGLYIGILETLNLEHRTASIRSAKGDKRICVMVTRCSSHEIERPCAPYFD